MTFAKENNYSPTVSHEIELENGRKLYVYAVDEEHALATAYQHGITKFQVRAVRLAPPLDGFVAVDAAPAREARGK